MVYSYRDFRIGHFKRKFNSCKAKDDRYGCEREVRTQYRRVESGRYALMSDKIHSFLVALDSDELDLVRLDMPKIIELGNEFGTIEELKKFK